MAHQLTLTETPLRGVWLITTPYFEDTRGVFSKIFHLPTFAALGLKYNIQETYYSVSKKDVIRGMHFQIPPAAHAKIVYVPSGAIADVVVDIRMGSPTYGHTFQVELSATNQKAIYISPGFAHGFKALQDQTVTTYLQTTIHSSEHDRGLHYASIGVDWQVAQPIVSQRDQTLVKLADFNSPFTYTTPNP